MARIRSIKPEFFRDEGLQELEEANPKARVMVTFAGLWCVSDRAGRFEWRPKHLHLDILPFVNYDLGRTLAILEEGGFINRYEVDGKIYGEIPGFVRHQSQSGMKHEQVRYPTPPAHVPDKTRTRPRQDLDLSGKEREGEGKGGGKEGTEKKEDIPPIVPPFGGTADFHESGHTGGNGKALTPEAVVKAWNDITAGTFPQVLELTTERVRKIRARLREPTFQQNYEAVMRKMMKSDFLCGRLPRDANDPHAGWKASFDWIIKNGTTYIQVLEGRHDNGEKPFNPLRAGSWHDKGTPTEEEDS